MRRRSERKRSTDVTSPAQPPATKRTSSRRSRKASTPDREKIQKEFEQSRKNEAEESDSVGKHGQPDDGVRKSRRSRRRTPKCENNSPPHRAASFDREAEERVDTIVEENEISLQDLNHDATNAVSKDGENTNKDSAVTVDAAAAAVLTEVVETESRNESIEADTEVELVVKSEKSKVEEPAAATAEGTVNNEVTNIPSPKANKEEELKTADILEIQTDDNEQLMGETGEESNGRASVETTSSNEQQIAQRKEVVVESEDVDANAENIQDEQQRNSEPKDKEKEEDNDQIMSSCKAMDIAEPITAQDAPKPTPAPLSVTTAPPAQRVIRKRKWVTSKSAEHATPVLAISSDSLRSIIATEVQPVPAGDVKLESSEEEGVITDDDESARSATPERRPPPPNRKVQVEKSEKLEPEVKIKVDFPSPDKTVDRKPNLAGTAVAAAAAAAAASSGRIARTPSPPRNRTSNILYITNLVRPFTVIQLKGLLARTGQIKEDGFWIDRIKSKCYVAYENEDQAVETRHALHGVRWPNSNPKALNVDFGSQVDMERAKLSTVDEQALNAKTNAKDSVTIGASWSRDQHEIEDRKLHRPVREWDLGKKENSDRDGRKAEVKAGKNQDEYKDSANGKNDRDRLNRRRSRERELRSRSNSPARKAIKMEHEPPARLLDDLFRKTKGTPCIYWLPLTPEQIAEKEILRQKREEDLKERARLRELEREKERERERLREKEREKERERQRERERDRERERERERERDRRQRDGRRNRSPDRHRDRVRSRSHDRRRF